jgi:hypothetical protein
MPPIKRITVEISVENLWFAQRHLNVFDFADIFPTDAFSSAHGRGVPVTFHTDEGYDIVSDIDREKMQLRNRSKYSGWMRWTGEKELQEGDRIVIDKLGDREFGVVLERKSEIQNPKSNS